MEGQDCCRRCSCHQAVHATVEWGGGSDFGRSGDLSSSGVCGMVYFSVDYTQCISQSIKCNAVCVAALNFDVGCIRTLRRSGMKLAGFQVILDRVSKCTAAVRFERVLATTKTCKNPVLTPRTARPRRQPQLSLTRHIKANIAWQWAHIRLMLPRPLFLTTRPEHRGTLFIPTSYY